MNWTGGAEGDEPPEQVEIPPEVGKGQINVPQLDQPVEIDPTPEIGAGGGVIVAKGTRKEIL